MRYFCTIRMLARFRLVQQADYLQMLLYLCTYPIPYHDGKFNRDRTITIIGIVVD